MRRPLLVLISSSAFALSACNCGKPQGLLETNGILVVTPQAVDFGAVTEFTQKKLPLTITNAGRGALTIAVALEDGTSADLTMGPAPVELAPGAQVDLELTFSPQGAGEDTGAVIITSDEPDRAPVRVPLHGGAIYPVLAFDEDPLGFAPVASSLVTKPATLRNIGGATLHVSAIGVSPQGSPDFSITAPQLPLSLAPDASVPVSVSYARSLNAAEGLLQVVSDERIDGGVHGLRLLPDPSRVCGDGRDNDNDGLTDFPDDPGCTSTEDDDEFNPPECVTGGIQPCGSTTGACRAGSRVCANSIWGACDGGVRAASETCNGTDDDCNGMTDENLSELCTINGCSGARACVPNSGVDGGLFTNCIPINSMPEACNGLDDNCNGQVDEGVVQTCTVFGCLGVKVCVPGTDGGFTSCMPTNPLPETCNGVDDNCNGQVDDLPDLVCGIGPCRRVVPACVSGAAGACLPGTPGVESCNGVDDDCNGTVDDGVAALTCGQGACANSVAACTAGGGMNVCMPLTASVETCNNVDDNCNGSIDDGIANLTCGVGACFRSVTACSGGSLQTCTPASPVSEICNNVDDNCNTRVDDSADGGVITQACYSGAAGTRGVGRCRDGAQNCVGGSFAAACNGEVLPASSETCGNNIDDNCNAQIDELCDGGPCDVNGVWRVNGSPIAYSCTFGFVNLNISQFNFATNVPGAGTMTVAPQFTWSPGSANFMTGLNSSCPSGSVDAGSVYSGTCTETYRLRGNFTGPNSFNGTFTATFTPSSAGACFDCSAQSFTIQLVRP